MKKIVFTLSILCTLVVSAFANETNVSKLALTSFASSFSGARNVSWSDVDEFHVARFTMDSKTKYAYYTASGELKLVAEQITESSLTDKQRQNLYKNFEAFTITDLFRIEDEEGTKVFAVLENESKKVILRTSSARWETISSRGK